MSAGVQDMYSIYDFHAEDAPPLTRRPTTTGRTPFGANFAKEEPGEGDDAAAAAAEEAEAKDPSDYATEGKFMVAMGDEKVYIDDVTVTNEAGWTPLHACCHSVGAVAAGKEVLAEVVRVNGDLNARTERGPGSFNANWTALHMACAYGILPMVQALIEAGADVDCRNSIDWTPLVEASHRGFLTIAGLLAKAGADVNHIPDDECLSGSPFLQAPPTTALGEAARCGFSAIIKVLVEAGADKDLANHEGWTPLHEAAFHNHLGTVKTLLIYGANPTIRNKKGALPYQLAALPAVRTTIREIWGEDAVDESMPNLSAGVFCATVPSMTMGLTDDMGDMINAINEAGEDDNEDASDDAKELADDKPEATTPKRGAAADDAGAKGTGSQRKGSTAKAAGPGPDEDGDGLIHRGGLLGDLPSLNKKSPSQRNSMDFPSARDNSEAATPGGKGDAARSSGKKKRSKKSKRRGRNFVAEPNLQIPPAFICRLSKRIMLHPVRTIYGNVYEGEAIRNWITNVGAADPITGKPLSLSDITRDEALAARIEKFLEEHGALAKQPPGGPDAGDEFAGAAASHAEAKGQADDDDLYDF
mmetsp:Transcript_16000/g.48874  ORF Transcript_16000/g.48874 Transcript_16000/m.48874 type:complete len:587 (+) Transcript_16000:330-2090(+)